MHPITLVFIITMAIIAFNVLRIIQKRPVQTIWIEAVKQLGGLGLALGVFGTIVGFFQMFGALEETKEPIPFQIIMGGTKVALITTIYGLVTFCISIFSYIILKLVSGNREN